MSNSAFQPTVLTVPSGTGGSGQGELNLVTNPTATTDTTGWSAVGPAATLGRGTSGGPLSPTIGTYFTIINTIGSPTESSTSGAYSVLTLPSGMQNRKLKVEFYYTSPAADTFKVSVYKGSTRVPLSTDSAGSTSLPQSTTGKFVAYFDTDSSGTWTVSITKTAGGGSTPLQFTNVVVGPGIQPQGAVVGPETVYPLTVGGSASAPTLGTNTAQAVYERIGDIMHIRYSLNQTTSGTAGSGTYLFSLPSGLTIDPSRLAATYQGSVGLGAVGTAAFTDGTKNYTGYAAVYNSTNLYLVVGNEVSTPSAMGSTTYSLAGATYRLSFEARVPVAEWAGSGTVQLAQNDVEYAYNTSGLTTAGGSNTFAFGYGPVGAVLGSIASTTQATSYTTMRVRFQTPIQAGDSIVVEFDGGQNQWMPAPNRSPWIINNAAVYGVQAVPVFGSLTDVDVLFGNSGQQSSGATTYGSSGSAWSNISTWKWRVRKSSAGAAVGFGIHQPGVSSGLVSASGLVGRTDGQVIPAGYVGEIIKNNSAVATTYAGSAVWYDATSFNLTAGIWLITTQLRYERNGATMAGEFLSGISTTSGNSSTGLVAGDNLLSNDNGSGTVNRGAITISSYPVNVTSTTTYYFKTRADFSAGSPNYIWSYRAVRIA